MQPTNMAYDRAITVFSPDGRLFQVEYAREAVKRGTTTVGLKYKDGAVLIVDKRITSRLIEPESIEKMFQIDDHIGCATSGLVADARVLVERARIDAQVNEITYNRKIEIKTLVRRLCDFKQTYTQYGGVRPFGTALLIAGVDDSGPRLFSTDPSGAMIEYKATSEGAGRDNVIAYFEKHYREDIDKDEAIILGLKALSKGVEGKINPDAIEIGVVDSSRKFRKLSREETQEYIKKALGGV
ncbi:MAG: archaeal proteasome endopeptidase complex subunit alpha [Thermoplasmata archaeon]|nr:MAG: archaeal proteasome endopeptidase complex subunit alpha [Thermoplasmata archaeon]KAA0017351.1 MAG: archaeal proteasome endopeptidase complex subunit alpha [Thermoplasmata archaeon]